MLPLKFGFNFDDLNSLSGLSKLDESFLYYISEQNHDLYNKLINYRLLKQNNIEPTEYSEFLVQLAIYFDDFIAELFSIMQENMELKLEHKKFDIIYECRRKFVQRHAVKTYPKEKVQLFNFEDICNDLKKLIGLISQQNIAKHYIMWQANDDLYKCELDLLAKYCAYMVSMNSSSMLFDIPRPINDNNHIRVHKIAQLQENPYLGFNHRDKQQSVTAAYAQSKYCIYCHMQKKDYCSKGLPKTKLTNPNAKNGCPLKQKISEMNLLKSEGFNIGALAVIVIDNPLIAVTGHRICNDCMKSCIFQKQDPVNIPLIESNILEQVLQLPWGVEIYLLLTKWNPLNIDQPLPLPNTNYNILVTGLGPAGFALSHYLLNDGHNVTAIDGLKITPLHFDATKPIKHYSDVNLPLSKRLPQGFGGVAEYGITNRWDKNNLSLVRLILQRRKNFTIHSGIRLGSNITIKEAFELGFDHVALCIGAGKPKFDDIPNYFANGVRIAADFLMNLQQGGAFIPSSNSNLQVRMPTIVIGCGLTAIDSAVELMHYYPVQVEKFFADWQLGQFNESDLTQEEKIIASEFIEHAKLFRKCHNDAEKIKIMQDIGGVSICYRNSLQDAPAYRLNHEEIEHALALGIKFEEYIVPQSIVTDRFNHVEEIIFSNGERKKAKTVLIAIGTENNEFQDIDEIDNVNSIIFKSIDKRISHFGDCNLNYAGSVVKALASVKDNYKTISDELKKHQPNTFKLSVKDWKSTVRSVKHLTNDIIELIVHAPNAAQNFCPGHFFKIQNYTYNLKDNIKPLALTGVEVNKKDGTITFAIKKVGTSSNLICNLTVGEEVMLMGPTGAPFTIYANKKIVLLGDNINIVGLIELGRALKENNCEIIFFADYSRVQDRFYASKINELVPRVFWSCQEDKLEISSPLDVSIKGTLIDNIKYAKNLGLLSNVEQVICSLNPNLAQTISKQISILFPNIEINVNVSTQMQCMMKGICGQCIQKTNDNKKYIFACACQNQNIKNIDFVTYAKRLKQNSLLEKMNKILR